jgi:hypothetical protein
MWVGGLACIVLAVALLAAFGKVNGWFESVEALPAIAAESTMPQPAPAGGTVCAEFGASDLRSPADGVWFQRNCTGSPASLSEGRAAAECNQKSLDPAEFELVAPGLYVFRQGQASPAFLWYASSANCFNLVSDKSVTVVCVDQTVSFSRNDDACASHGGVLIRVNAR